MLVDIDVRGQQGMDFLLGEELLWIMELYFYQKWWFEVKNVLIINFLPEMMVWS